MRSLALVGCGKMGGALLSGWHAAGVLDRLERLTVISPSAKAPVAHPKIHYVRSLNEAGAVPEALLFAVKPQQMSAILPDYARWAGNASPLLMTVAAGKEAAFYQKYFGARMKLVRAMPNTPALIGQGVTALYAGVQVSPEEKHWAERLFRAVGSCYWLADEELLAAATAVAGCGPAYVFYFLECWARAGEQVGLPAELAARMAQETLSGAVALLIATGESPATLRRNVASPGGTTQAALDALESGELEKLLASALAAAVRRAGEIAAEG